MPSKYNTNKKSYLTAYLLLFFLGWLGGHRYYLGHWKSGFLYMITLGLFGYGLLADTFLLYFMVKKKNSEKPKKLKTLALPSIKGIFFSAKKEKLAPWARKKTNVFFKLFDLFDDLLRILLFLIGPLFIMLSSLYVDGSLIVGLVVVFILVLVGYVNNMNHSLTLLTTLMEKYPQLGGIPFLSDVIASVRGFYEYYYHNKPKSVIYYLFYPFFFIFTLKSNQTENGLYKNIVLLILVTLLIDTALSSDQTYMSIWVIMGQILFIVFMVLTLSIMPLIPIVTTAFKFRFSGKQTIIKILATLSLLLMIFIVIEEQDKGTLGTTLFSELTLEYKMENPEFQQDLRVDSEMFLSYYFKRLPKLKFDQTAYKDATLTDSYRQQLIGIVTEDEAKMFSIVLLPDSNNKAWIGVHYATWTFGIMEKPVMLFLMSPDGIFYSSWKQLPNKIKARFILSDKIDEETYTPNQISRQILLNEYEEAE